MKTTNKLSCRTIIGLIASHGVKDVVLSPGSRNAPLIIAARRSVDLRTHVVIDERTAAFFGLGIALQTGRPVALICTSGSAVLNYGPAMAEAYYRHVPLIVISADRPQEWIDQDDSQTIRQTGVLDNIVKGSFDIGVETGSRIQADFINRTVNDAILLALRAPWGPVHINVRLDEPLGELAEADDRSPRVIGRNGACALRLAEQEAAEMAARVSGRRTLVIAGFGNPDHETDKAIEAFAKVSGAVIMCEAQSNLHVPSALCHIDAVLSSLSEDELERMKPQLVITLGGSLVSRMVKSYLRRVAGLEHWHIGSQPHSVDCFMALTRRVEIAPAEVFDSMTSRISRVSDDNLSFRDSWLSAAAKSAKRVADFFAECPWSDFYAMGRLMQLLPDRWNLQLSNGTVVRYVQLFDYSRSPRIDCNRGVSGIDGCTSTAIGAHLHHDGITLLVSGDMSAQYDAGALALTEISPRFKMAVLNNGGGGIFRFIASTSTLDECEPCFAADVRLPLDKLAEAYGFAYFEAAGKAYFDNAFRLFAEEDRKPAILNIITPPRLSADILKQFFNQK